jgi:branched-chain amino acid transport system ATP-binding protein
MGLMLDVVDIHTYYGESHILQGVSIRVEESSVVALLGRNGMGKTTTIRSIIGFTAPRSGKVVFKGRDLAGLRPDRIAQIGVGLVPQGRRIFSELTVRQNLTVAARGTRKPGARSLEGVYSLFPILRARANLRGDLLSGGEMQMLSIGRALMTNPTLVLMDEPSEGLAPLIVRELGRIINELHKSGLSILLVEQHLPLALRLADYVYILSKGVIVYQSPPDELSTNDEAKAMHIGITRNVENLRIEQE